ncbi:enoyl-CoA hydratase-related protein [Parahaliea mediterranea]|uniref:p-hydroxycinnamoyl CoA hydratase/lyase n=1 Tax=Parahaliea mediterranea TaxID=651086 RepID=A0A939IJD4_9GAMM|nr:enoyl-CoA hydratase-related protein [Parahaliea mediterranea]MBN7796171.1 p-hydroxycinnamoyl CoA hydratase/lyase [Parahaliea mediterranea]
MTTVRKEKDDATCTVEGGIAWLELDLGSVRCREAPALNRKVIRILDEIEFDRTVGVLVLVVEGCMSPERPNARENPGKNVSSGTDAERRPRREAQSWWNRLYCLRKPTIAMVTACRVDGAYDPVSACDLAFADIDTQFMLDGDNCDAIPGMDRSPGTTGLLSMRGLMYHALTGESINGATAAEWGLVNEALPADRLRARVIQVANTLR